jgi:hypothetical protein
MASTGFTRRVCGFVRQVWTVVLDMNVDDDDD